MAAFPQSLPTAEVEAVLKYLLSGGYDAPSEEVAAAAWYVAGYGVHLAYGDEGSPASAKLGHKPKKMGRADMAEAFKLAQADPQSFDWTSLVPICLQIIGLFA